MVIFHSFLYVYQMLTETQDVQSKLRVQACGAAARVRGALRIRWVHGECGLPLPAAPRALHLSGRWPVAAAQAENRGALCATAPEGLDDWNRLGGSWLQKDREYRESRCKRMFS
jgi:hypothetical protein